jgi:hypothetical protein
MNNSQFQKAQFAGSAHTCGGVDATDVMKSLAKNLGRVPNPRPS